MTETISAKQRGQLGGLVAAFMAEMHRYDHGRTLPLLNRANLTAAQLAMLEVLRQPQTMSAVARTLGLSRPATSQMIEKLVQKKLVRRTEGAADRRQRTVELSPRGKALRESIHAARALRFEASLAVLPPPLRDRLAKVLGEVAEAFHRARAGVAES